jgi:hypothetical protein
VKRQRRCCDLRANVTRDTNKSKQIIAAAAVKLDDHVNTRFGSKMTKLVSTRSIRELQSIWCTSYPCIVINIL